MANQRRGEVALDIAGTPHVLRLTLNALAEIESAFACDGLAALGTRLGSGGLRTGDLVALLGAALRGGGSAMTDAEVGEHVEAADLAGIAEALGRLFALNFGRETSSVPRQARRHVPTPCPSPGTT